LPLSCFFGQFPAVRIGDDTEMKTIVALLIAMGLAAASTAAFAEDCEDGTTWDPDTETCVPTE
jgi:hypothetical protein